MPPVPQVPLLVKLSALVVKAMRDLMSNDPADGAIVEIFRTAAAEENSLQNAGWELN